MPVSLSPTTPLSSSKQSRPPPRPREVPSPHTGTGNTPPRHSLVNAFLNKWGSPPSFVHHAAWLAALTETSHWDISPKTFRRNTVLNSPRPFLASFLSVLFFVVSFNAYVCLLPINGTTPVPMANGCTTPDERPVFQYCDTFKTLGVQSADDDQALCQADTVSLAHYVILNSGSSRLSDYPIVSSPQDLLLKISVLRI